MADIMLPFKDGLKTPHKHSKEDVEHIRQWLNLSPHLPTISDDHIHLFLHTNRCQLEPTKQNIENFFTLRTHAPDLFSGWDATLPALQKKLDITVSARTKARTPEGYTVLFNRFSDPDSSKFDMLSMLKLFFMMGDMCISEDGLIGGYISVFDMKGITLAHLAGVNISAVKSFMSYIQDGAPIRVVGVHVINPVSFMDRIVSLIKPFMKPELQKMLQIHGPPEDLAKIFPPEVIPKDYGGTGEDSVVLHAQCRVGLEKTYRPFLQKMSALTVDESKRTGKSAGGQKLFGAEGSFRTLSID